MGMILDIWCRFNQNRHVRKVTGSKLTGFYAALSVSYCAMQVIFLAATWQVNYGAGHRVETMVQTTGNGIKEFSYLDYSTGSPQIRLCPQGISTSYNKSACPIIWPNPASSRLQAPPARSLGRRTTDLTFTFFPNNGTLNIAPYDGLKVNGEKPPSTISLDQDCVQAIKWPYHHLLMTRREDVVAACFQAFLLFMSITALMTQSIPHIGASFFLHLFALGWSATQIYLTRKFEIDYHVIITGAQGACPGIDLISDYFKTRTTFQIGTATINFLSALISTFLCWRLFGRYGWATFKRMGASRTIARAYKFALVLLICIQLECFFYIASVGSYLDEISKEILGATAQFRKMYLIGYSVTTACVIPWLGLAWYGIRRENKKMMFGFFFLSVLYLGISGAMFVSHTFKQTFKHWTFIASLFTVSWALLLMTTALAVVCTLNFGQGLPHYFERRNGEEADDYDDDFHPSPDEKAGDLEKVIFPSPCSEDAVVIAFPSTNSPLQYIKRSESASSYMSQESRGSTRLPPLQATSSRDVPRVVIPQLPNAVLGRNLTASAQSSKNSSFSPSWTPGDDKAMMANPRPLQRFESASSFGNLDSAQMHGDLDRDFSFGTQASSDIFVPIKVPQRSLTNSSKMSAATTDSTYSYSSPTTPSKKKKIDLGAEL